MPNHLRSLVYGSLLVPVVSLGIARGGVHDAPPTAAPADAEFVFIPGTRGVGNDGVLASGIEAQVRRTLDNIAAQLRAQGMDLSHVVSMNVYLSDTRHFAAMNEVYRTYFRSDPPTRATVGVDLLLPGALVQMSGIAARPGVAKRVITPAGIRSPELPYSWGVLAGNTLFIAGATSRDPATYQPVTGDVGTQTRRVFENIGLILAGANMTHADLAQCQVFLADGRDFGGMNTAYREFFEADPGVRATVRAALMNPAFNVEIQCVAERGANRAAVYAEGQSPGRLPFSPAIRVNNRLYLAGMLGRGPDGYGDIEDQTRRTLDNLNRSLTAGGMTFADVHDIKIWVPDIRHGEAVSRVLDQVVGATAPRVLVGAGLMGTGAAVEIMMTAGK